MAKTIGSETRIHHGRGAAVGVVQQIAALHLGERHQAALVRHVVVLVGRRVRADVDAGRRVRGLRES